MSPITSTQTLDNNRIQILDAAEMRFREVGFGKTTMAEIANDVGMSAANLYRYFENKNDIGCACAKRCMSERINRLRTVVHKTGLNAPERLRAYVHENLNYSFEISGNDKNISELVLKILTEHKDMVFEKVDAEMALIAEILAQGNSSGEFSVEDILVTARNIQTAIVLFDVPTFMGLYTLEKFQNMADGVVDLILAGLEPR